MDEKIAMVVNVAPDIFLKGNFSGRQVSWAKLKASDKKLGLRRTPT